jgi:hypothetical protein
MPIRFTQGEIMRLLKQLRFRKCAKKSNLYEGIGIDGSPHICKMDYHKDRDQVATGTALKIAKSLGFADLAAMKDYMDGKR